MIPESGPISLAALRNEFNPGATGPISLGSYYRGNNNVGAGAPNVPTSGPISLSQFRGAAREFHLLFNSNNATVNVHAQAVAAGWNGADPLFVEIASGVRISATSATGYAMWITGSFPGGVRMLINTNAIIVGRGGQGGTGSNGDSNGLAGQDGGPALLVQAPTTIDNRGTIAAGGAGGGGGGGGTTNDGAGYGGLIYWYGGGGGGGQSGMTDSLAGPAGGFSALAGGAGTFSSAAQGGRGTNGPTGTPRGGTGGSGGGWGQGGWSGLSPSSMTTHRSPGPGGGTGVAVAGDNYINWVVTGARFGLITAL